MSVRGPTIPAPSCLQLRLPLEAMRGWALANDIVTRSAAAVITAFGDVCAIKCLDVE